MQTLTESLVFGTEFATLGPLLQKLLETICNDGVFASQIRRIDGGWRLADGVDGQPTPVGPAPDSSCLSAGAGVRGYQRHFSRCCRKDRLAT